MSSPRGPPGLRGEPAVPQPGTRRDLWTAWEGQERGTFLGLPASPGPGQEAPSSSHCPTRGPARAAPHPDAPSSRSPPSSLVSCDIDNQAAKGLAASFTVCPALEEIL